MKGTVRSAIAVFLLVMPAIAQQQRTPPSAAPAAAVAIRAGRLIDPEPEPRARIRPSWYKTAGLPRSAKTWRSRQARRQSI